MPRPGVCLCGRSPRVRRCQPERSPHTRTTSHQSPVTTPHTIVSAEPSSRRRRSKACAPFLLLEAGEIVLQAGAVPVRLPTVDRDAHKVGRCVCSRGTPGKSCTEPVWSGKGGESRCSSGRRAASRGYCTGTDRRLCPRVSVYGRHGGRGLLVGGVYIPACGRGLPGTSMD